MPQHKIIEKYFFFGLLLLVIVFCVFIFKPFLAVIALSGALSVVLYPLFLWINKHIAHGIRWLSSLVTVLVFVIVLCGPMFLIGSAVFTQSQNLYQSVSSNTSSDGVLTNIGEAINNYLPDSMALDVEKSIKDATTFITSHLAQIFTTTLSAILGFLLVLFSMFYFLKDAQIWHRMLVQLSPLSDKDDENILLKLERAINGVIKGYLLIGLVQGILVGIGFAIFGIPNPALFGVLAGITSLVPSIGTALVCVPAVLYLWATGDTGHAIALAVWCGALVGTVDNILNPIVVGKNINLPPILILFSVLGGISLMGPIGILIGPLTLSLLYALISIYRGRSVA